MKINKIYLLPGLGCDNRVFGKFVAALDTHGADVHCLEWLPPISLSESIVDYAKRLTANLDTQNRNIIIIGLSLGGMVATELAKIIPPKKLFLISTIKHQSERPTLLNFAKIIPVHHLTPTWFTLTMAPRLARWLKISDKESSLLFGKMLQTMPKGHLRWARHRAVHWLNTEMPINCIHINGSKDHIFNHPKMKIDYTIKNGTHNMIMDRSDEIATIVNKEIKNLLA